MAKNRVAPKSFRYAMDLDTMVQRISTHLFLLLQSGTIIDLIKFRGKIDDQDYAIEFYNREDKLRFSLADETCLEKGWNDKLSVSLGSKNAINFSAERKSYRLRGLRRFKTKIDSHSSGDYDEAKEHLNKIKTWLNLLPVAENETGSKTLASGKPLEVFL
jgi:hypothetical protein